MRVWGFDIQVNWLFTIEDGAFLFFKYMSKWKAMEPPCGEPQVVRESSKPLLAPPAVAHQMDGFQLLGIRTPMSLK